MGRADDEVVFEFGEDMGFRGRPSPVLARKSKVQFRGKCRGRGGNAIGFLGEFPELLFTGAFLPAGRGAGVIEVPEAAANRIGQGYRR